LISKKTDFGEKEANLIFAKMLFQGKLVENRNYVNNAFAGFEPYRNQVDL